MPVYKAKKAKSPTGKASKVRKEMKDFDAGKKVAGKRPTRKKVTVKKKKTFRPGPGLIGGAAADLKRSARKGK